MKILSLTLLSTLCFLFTGTPAQAQSTDIEVKGSLAMGANMSRGKACVLKNGDAVLKTYEPLRKAWIDARKAAVDVDKVGKAPKNETSPAYRKWKQKRESEEKQFKAKLEIYNTALKAFETSLEENTGDPIEFDSNGRFIAKASPTSYFYLHLKKEDRGYIWIVKGARTVEFNNMNKLQDPTIAPKITEDKK